VSYPASQRAHGKPARDEESASNRSAVIGMLELARMLCAQPLPARKPGARDFLSWEHSSGRPPPHPQ
jgi:hypothetical protein